jgi:hypothetical protein
MTATVSARFEGSILPRSGLSLFARWQKKRRRIQYPGRLSTAGSGLDAQNVAPEMAPEWICDSSNVIPDSISAIFGPAAAHGVTQKPVPQINHGVLSILP